MVTRRQLKEENEKLKRDLEEVHKQLRYYKDALASVKDSNFKKYKDVPLNDVMEKMNNNNLTFGEAVYLYGHVLPLMLEGNKKVVQILGDNNENAD